MRGCRIFIDGRSRLPGKGVRMARQDRDLVVITGGGGFIGRALMRRWAGKFQAISLERHCHEKDSADGRCFAFDLTSERSVEDALAQVAARYGRRFASVIHLAGYYDFSGEPSPLYQEVNVHGTERLLRKLQAYDVEQFLFASTMLVHAPCEPGQRIDENWPLDPRWVYPESKLTAEQLILALRDGVPVVLLRMAGVYDDLCHSPFLAHQIERIYEHRLIGHVYPGDIHRGQAALHADDLVAAIAQLVERRAQLPSELPLLVGEEETLSYDDIQRALGRLITGTAWGTEEIPKSLAKAGAWLEGKLEPVIPDSIDKGEQPFIKPWMVDLADQHYALRIARARALLDWAPRHRLRDGLPRIVAALKSEPGAWYRANRLTLPVDWTRGSA